MNPLIPTPELFEKLAGIVHAALHQVPPGSITDRLCRDPDVIAWTKAMDMAGLLPPLPTTP